jgi:hypothetical protein
MTQRNYLLLFERERTEGSAEDAFDDLRTDYNWTFNFRFVGRHQLDSDVFRKPDEDEREDNIRIERDILVVTLAWDGDAKDLMKVLDDYHHKTACGGYFTVVGDSRCGWVEPVSVVGWRDEINA